MPFRTLCVLLRRRASRTAFPRWSVGNDHLNCCTALCVDISIRTCGTIIAIIVRRSASHAVPDAPRPLATRSVENCIPTLERRERSSQLPYGALRRHIDPDVRNDHRNYRATLRVACLSGRSASSCDAERRELHSHAGACGTITQLTYDALRQPSTLSVIELPWPRSRARFCCRHHLPPASRRADH